jgi:hypothetical protein
MFSSPPLVLSLASATLLIGCFLLAMIPLDALPFT